MFSRFRIFSRIFRIVVVLFFCICCATVRIRKGTCSVPFESLFTFVLTCWQIYVSLISICAKCWKSLRLQTHVSRRKISSSVPVQAHLQPRQNKYHCQSSDSTDPKEATSVDLIAVKVLCGIGLREIQTSVKSSQQNVHQ